MRRSSYPLTLVLLLLLLVPHIAAAQVSSIIFTSPPQNIEAGIPSDVLTLTAQDSGGNPVAGGIPQTGCIALTTSSQTGQFSSSAASWNPVTVFSMNKGTSKRSFYFQDSASGEHVLNAAFVLKPISVSDSCAAWPQSEWGTVFRASQTISVGISNPTSKPDKPSNDESTPLTTATTQVSTPSAGGLMPEALTVQINTEPVAVVGAGSFFSGSASDTQGLKGSDTRYVWNFGDGTTDETQTVFHAYAHPGKYVIFLTAASGNQTGTGRALVQVVPAQIGLLVEPDGSVVLSNQSSRELNIGLWNITSGNTTFPIPQNTVLLSGQSIHFSSELMRMVAGDDVVLRYPNNVPVLTVSPSQELSSDFAEPEQDPVRPAGGRPSGSSEPWPGLAQASATFFAPTSLEAASNSADGGALQRDGARTEQISRKEIVYPESADVAGSLWAAVTQAAQKWFYIVPYALGALGFILIGVGLFFRKTL